MTMITIWIIGLVHCVINGRLSRINKFGWIIFIFIANWIGALAYFLYWFGFTRRQHEQIAPTLQHPLPEQEYPSYTTGYQPVRTTSAKVLTDNVTESEKALSASPSASEEMQIVYPEDPR
jgi:hypothetical protein